MALVLHLKYVENLRGRGDRLAKVSFRGKSSYFCQCLVVRLVRWLVSSCIGLVSFMDKQNLQHEHRERERELEALNIQR